MYISKYRYGKYFDLFLLFHSKKIKFEKCIMISINCVICSLLKKKKKKKCPLLIHSSFELYILHTYIRLCGTVHLSEFQTHTQKRRTDEEDM